MTSEDVRAAKEHIANTLRQMAVEQGRDTPRIRALNDRLRTTGRGGMVVMTEAVAALGGLLVDDIFRALAAFDGFTLENDILGEHMSGTLSVDGVEVRWEIDYLDRARRFRSLDPANPKLTVRILTVMRADEY